MLRVVEAFSGVGAQAKALKNIGVDYEIVSTIEWDINAIYAYDIIHNGAQNLSLYDDYTKDELVEILSKYSLSGDGKKPLTLKSLSTMHRDLLVRIYCAIERTHDLVSITDVSATDLPNDIGLFTYSFPCQDLSICGAWHNNKTGITRGVKNRSGMLWEVERILKEYVEINKPLPTFLLMENVSNILSETHKKNFEEWQDYLESIGYINKVYTLNAKNFGIPQNRVRTYMISVLVNDINKKNVLNYFEENDLEINQNSNGIEMKPLMDYLRVDYTNVKYKTEADISNPNDTPSRKKIYKDNVLLYDGEKIRCNIIKTITTKQDRNPNSGLVAYKSDNKGKAQYRNLTPRECFLLMGFDEEDYDKLDNNNFVTRGRKFYGREKLVKLAGNSIVVKVLESIFEQIIFIQENIL